MSLKKQWKMPLKGLTNIMKLTCITFRHLIFVCTIA